MDVAKKVPSSVTDTSVQAAVHISEPQTVSRVTPSTVTGPTVRNPSTRGRNWADDDFELDILGLAAFA